jgi:hypothetical protein
MLFFGWPFCDEKAKPFDPWEKTATTGMDLLIQDTRRYLTDSDYFLPKDQFAFFRSMNQKGRS